MSYSVEFIVHGVPAPQGSKNAWGGEDNPQTKPWRASVATVAAEHMPDGPLLGPVSVVVDFVFPRPKSHYRTGRYADWLKETAPALHTSPPDLDKLCRALGDAFKGTVVRDDSQIAAWSVRKVYGAQPCARIVVSTLDRERVT